MIISRAPTRITLGGGGTDLKSYYSKYGGFLIAGAINRYCTVLANKRFYNSIRLSYSQLEVKDRVEDIDYTHSRGLNKQVMMELANTQWITAGRNVLVTGPTGIGKSYIACALGNSAARTGYTVLYARAPRLFETLQQARGDGSHLKVLDKLSRVQLLIVDDFLLTPLSEWERRDLLELAEGRYDAGATVIASQCPVSEWHPAIADPTLTDAICDRLLHNAYRIELKEDSMRRKPGESKRAAEISADKGGGQTLKIQTR